MFNSVDLRPRYPFDSKDVPGDYVLCGDGWWYPNPEIEEERMSRKDKVAKWVAYMLPKRIVYWAAFRVISNATTGKHSKQEVPALTCVEAMARWDPL